MSLFGPSKREKAYLETLNISTLLEQNFELIVEEVFTIVGVGTVVSGIIQSGMCRQNEDAIIEKINGETLYTRITYVDIHSKERKNNGCGYRTEHVGIGLRSIRKEQLEKGDKIIIKNANKFGM